LMPYTKDVPVSLASKEHPLSLFEVTVKEQ